MKTYKVTVDEKGTIRYYNEAGEYHREDGPAVIDGDIQAWYLNGKRHREDGPAIINGDRQEWYLNGKKLTESEFNQLTNKQCDVTITINDKQYRLVES